MLMSVFKVVAIAAVAAVAVVLGLRALSAPREAAPEPAAEPSRVEAAASERVVVLELFTSQGCSSCPAADSLLAKIAEDAEFTGRVVPLSFHVDYWNYIGWADPFSASTWTERQGTYNRALGHDGLYTPQLVIGGRSHVVGSDEQGAAREIAGALAAEPGARVGLAPVRIDGRKLSVTATVALTRAEDVSGSKVYGIVFENGLVTPIRRGENNGRTLRNDFVVRRLVELGDVSAKTGSARDVELAIELDSSWKPENLGVAVLVQDPKSMRIHGAAARQVRQGDGRVSD
jgi:hypothetical protein